MEKSIYDFKISLVIPFYNRRSIIKSLYSNLKKIDISGIELIIVDDGSTDNSIEMIKSNFIFDNLELKVYQQENLGPGGARNTGLDLASGVFVWFVDSDDYISVEALNFVLNNWKELQEVDFIDFDINSKGVKTSSMSKYFQTDIIIYNENIEKRELISNFGRLCTKVFKIDFLKNNHVYYPENCFYEDNYLLFVLPYYTKKFYKSSICGYYHVEIEESITRNSRFNMRNFDRFVTAYEGINWAVLNINEDLELYVNKFNKLFFVNSLFMLLAGIKNNYRFYNLWEIFRLLLVFNYCTIEINMNLKVKKKSSIIRRFILVFFKSNKYNMYYYYYMNYYNWGNKGLALKICNER